MASNEFSGDYMQKHRSASGVEDFFPGTLTSVTNRDHGLVELTCDNGVILRIHVLEDRLVRFRFTTEGRFEDDFSYAIAPAYQPQPPALEVVEFGDGVAIKTALISIRIARQGLKTTITELASGRIMSADEKGFHWEDNRQFGGEVVKMSKLTQPGEHYYGLGDKACELNLRGRRCDLWGSDTYAYGPDTDPLYKNIPFYLGLVKGCAYGIFFDNTFRSTFDFGQERPTVTSFFAQGGEMNYYYIHGPAPLDVIRAYTRLTGLPEMPPLWALGYHQCKWSYYPEAMVRGIAAGFRSRRIPCDAIYLDIDYMDGYRCFTWDAERFPDPKKLVSELEADGFKTVAIIDPGLKIDPNYPIWLEGVEKDYFCRRSDGPLFRGSVWPGLCHFPDFTHPPVRDWWAGLFKGLIEDVGLRGIWNDMNEPAVFEGGTFPHDVRHAYDGHPCSHRKAHNIYGMQMVRATREGLRRFGHGRRPFSITRSAYAGTQRFACAWTGDNVASWEHLRIANIQCQRLATSGMSFIGSDVGGFIEDPTPELYTRWVQMAVFHPFFRTHSSGDHHDQEPWSFGEETTALVRKAIEDRYRLIPTLYTTFRQYVTEGTPMLRSLALVAYQETDTYWRGAEFFLGDHLYVVPMTKPGEGGRFLYLPDDVWFSYWDDTPPKATAKDIWVECPEDHIPVFVHGGAVLPHWPVQQFVGEIADPEPELHLWWTPASRSSEWYEDDGDGDGHHHGDFRHSHFEVDGSHQHLHLRRSWHGHWQPRYPHIHLVLRALPDGHTNLHATANGQPLAITTQPGQPPRLTLPSDFSEVSISWQPAPAPAETVMA